MICEKKSFLQKLSTYFIQRISAKLVPFLLMDEKNCMFFSKGFEIACVSCQKSLQALKSEFIGKR